MIPGVKVKLNVVVFPTATLQGVAQQFSTCTLLILTCVEPAGKLQYISSSFRSDSICSKQVNRQVSNYSGRCLLLAHRSPAMEFDTPPLLGQKAHSTPVDH